MPPMDRKLHIMSRQCNAAFVMVLLSGCTTLIPPYTTPSDSALPAHYQQGAGKRFEDAALTSAADKTWQSYFPDPHLQALIRQALLHNHDLRSAALRVRQAQAAYRIERSSLTPTVALGVDAQRSRTPADLSEIGQTSTGNEFKAGLGISSWEIDFWWRRWPTPGLACASWMSACTWLMPLRPTRANRCASSHVGLRWGQ